MATVSVRYIVNDVDEAISFYCQRLGFHEDMHPAPTFAMLSRGDLRLVLSAPGGGPGGGQAMADGTMPRPGGWNRFSIEVSDLAAMVQTLRDAGAHFRNDVATGVGGKQILVEDPSGNPIELFEPSLPEASLSIPDESADQTDDRVASRARNLLPEEEPPTNDAAKAQAAAILDESDVRSAGPSGDRAGSAEHRTSDDATEPVD
jgi:catechol 2,3-dioxygenase-like lactoylglutathione lyase family enzyme